jgi:anaerobic selenocysteine-containing dehydrogenase
MTKQISRRDFLKLGGVGAAAAAVLTGCGPASRYVTRRPYQDMPEYNQTGVSTYFATTCMECPAGCGLIVRTREGRAIKAEGNPEHPVNQGKICPRGLTALQGLYNPDRVTGPTRQNRSASAAEKLDWNTAMALVAQSLKDAPQQIAFLLGAAPHHLADFVGELAVGLGGAPAPVVYSAYDWLNGAATLRQATVSIFGSARMPYFDISGADVVVSFGADFLEGWVSPLAYSRLFGQMRRNNVSRRARLVMIEPRMSVTGGAADLWLPAASGSEWQVALALGGRAAELRGKPAPGTLNSVSLAQAASASGISEEKLDEVATLLANAKAPVIIPGGSVLAQANGLAIAEAALLLNELLGALGTQVWLSPSAEQPARTLKDVQDLIARMNAGQVKTLFIHGVNPLFDLPAAFGFAEALKKVGTVISFASFPDETALASDQRVLSGSSRQALSGAQPVIVPLHDTRATLDVLLGSARILGGTLSAALPYLDEFDFIMQKLIPYRAASHGSIITPDILTFLSFFQQKGGWWSEVQPEVPQARIPASLTGKTTAVTTQDGKFHLHIIQTQMGDGRGANRPWLQETPDPMTTLMWNSWVEIHPETAAKLGIKDDDVVKISSVAGEIEASVYLYPAIRPDTIAIPFGQGHTALGRYAAGRGCNPANLLSVVFNPANDLVIADTLVTITPTGKTRQLARLESRVGVYGDGH